MTFDALTLDGLQRILADVHERENDAWRKINAELRKQLSANCGRLANDKSNYSARLTSCQQINTGGDGI